MTKAGCPSCQWGRGVSEELQERTLVSNTDEKGVYQYYPGGGRVLCRESGVTEGLVLVNAMHITASVFINDDESGLHHDFEVWLEKLAPHEPVSQYRHNAGEDNADGHLKRQIMGREVVVAVTKGQARLRPMGADLLRRVRREKEEEGLG